MKVQIIGLKKHYFRPLVKLKKCHWLVYIYQNEEQMSMLNHRQSSFCILFSVFIWPSETRMYECHFMVRLFISIRKLLFVRFTLCRTAPEPICQEADAPAVTHAAVTSWQKSMASLEGDITCHGDYLYSGDDTPQVRCLATGQWETHVTGACKQRIWREISVSVGQRFGQHKCTWPTVISRAFVLNAPPPSHPPLKEGRGISDVTPPVWNLRAFSLIPLFYILSSLVLLPSPVLSFSAFGPFSWPLFP